MNPREHHVAHQPPAWSRRAQQFRKLTLRASDPVAEPVTWRTPRDVQRRNVLVRRWLRRVCDWALNFIHEDPRERRLIFDYLIVATWIVMCVIGVLASWGIHP